MENQHQLIDPKQCYKVFLNGICLYTWLNGWQTALAHAEKLFNEYNELNKKYNCNHKVEILNILTGEIVTYEEAKRRADALKSVN